MISPDGKKNMFLHRWYIPSGKRFDRLMIADKNGQNLKILADEEMVSHCCWYRNNSIIGFFHHSSHGNSFYKIDIETSSISLLSEKLKGLGDGHPTVVNNKMVFDSYPDRSRIKKLYIYNLEEDTLKEIGEFVEPMKYFGETRCDLHPKWNYEGSKIFIDSVHSRKRMLYELEIE